MSDIQWEVALQEDESRLANRLRDQLYRVDAAWLTLAPAADESWLWAILAEAPDPARLAALPRRRIAAALRNPSHSADQRRRRPAGAAAAAAHGRAGRQRRGRHPHGGPSCRNCSWSTSSASQRSAGIDRLLERLATAEGRLLALVRPPDAVSPGLHVLLERAVRLLA